MRSHQILLFVLLVLAPLASAVCGDGVVNAPLEQCDGTNLDGKTCQTFCDGSGTLTCTATCHFNISQCVANICGDGVALQAEQCDNNDLKGQTCASLGFDAGTLHCSSCAFDTSGCSKCGDGAITAGVEPCDHSLLNGQTCQTKGFDTGVLACNSACTAFNTTDCYNWCGDGIINNGEHCDGNALGGRTCYDEGFHCGGTLHCNSSCGSFDTHACVACYCGDGSISYIDGETCDGSNLDGLSCAAFGFDGGVLTCSAGCGSFDFSGCYKCGDGVKNGAEQCDGTDLASATCTTRGFDGGSLSCSSTCTFNTGACYKCGDGNVNPGEECDGSALNNVTCQTRGFDTGSISCSSTCHIVTSACYNWCGDGIINNGETCDGTALNSHTCVTEGFESGTLSCASNCGSFVTTNCVKKDCLLGKTTLVDIVTCYDTASIPTNGLTTTLGYPSDAVRDALASVTKSMLEHDATDCSDISLPSALVGVMQIRTFTENNVTYCIALDTADADSNGKWDNGYMFLATPARRWNIHRRLHIAIPHPGAGEAAVIAHGMRVFQNVGAHSYLTTGISKAARADASLNLCHQYTAYPTDANENNLHAFHTVFSSMYNTSNAHSWAPVYFQMHGGSPTACGATTNTPDIYITNGMGGTANYPTGCLAYNLKAAILATPYPQNYTSWTGAEATASCQVLGTTVLQGRLVNGVAASDLCTTPSSSSTQKFLHVEIKPLARAAATSQVYWYDAIKAVIATDCASGRTYDSTSKMCV